MLKPLCLLSAGALIALSVTAFDTPAPEEAPAVERARPDVAFDGSAIAALSVKDLAAAKRWYAEVLGFEVSYELAEQGWCEMSTPVSKTKLGLTQDAEASPSRGSTFALGVEDVVRARAWLAGKKVAMDEIVEIPETVKLLYFRDPDGNGLMFYEPY